MAMNKRLGQVNLPDFSHVARSPERLDAPSEPTPTYDSPVGHVIKGGYAETVTPNAAPIPSQNHSQSRSQSPYPILPVFTPSSAPETDQPGSALASSLHAATKAAPVEIQPPAQPSTPVLPDQDSGQRGAIARLKADLHRSTQPPERRSQRRQSRRAARRQSFRHRPEPRSNYSSRLGDIHDPDTAQTAPPAPLPSPKVSRQRQRSQAQARLWSRAWAAGILIMGAMGFTAYHWLTHLPPAPDCTALSPLSTDGDRLYCAQMKAQSGELEDLVAGIDLIKDWKPGHPMYRKAQTDFTAWSAALLTQAKTALEENGLERAVEIASYIPEGSPLYEEAQERIVQWQGEWQQGEVLYQKGLDALKQQDWGVASDQVKAMGALPQPQWHQQRADELAVRLLKEKEAHQILLAAQDSADAANAETIIAGLERLQALPPQTFVWQDAQALVQTWSAELVKQAMAAMAAGNMERAFTLAQAVPFDQVDGTEAADLVRFSHAQQRSQIDDSPWHSNPVDIWRLMEAIAIAQDIAPESPFHPLAQAAIAQWQAELEDLSQLQLAQWTADLGQRFALDLAIQQAAVVEPDRPRRLQAQTLIAHWNQQLQIIIDRPRLALARRLAEPGTLEAFQAALAQAKAIGQDRAIWPQAEVAIAEWTEQIQAIEDGPILEKARQLATEGQWQQAIAEAERIGSDRALYAAAQDSIEEWRAELRLEIDQQHLADARSLASQQRLTEAISVASQIQPGQPLYLEAQSEIGRWIDERDARWAEQNRQAPTAPAPPPTAAEPAPSAAGSSPAGTDSTGSTSGGNRYDGSYEGYFDSRYYDYHR